MQSMPLNAASVLVGSSIRRWVSSTSKSIAVWLQSGRHFGKMVIRTGE
jgi:hypothetical protein